MKRFLKVVSWCALALFVGAQVIRPDRTNPPVDPALQYRPAPELEKILRRACYNCHSNETKWPWYSNIAPVSWLVAGHVRDGRRRLNFSEWRRYSEDRRKVLTYEVCEAVESQAMPMPSYLWMHPEAKLSDEDRETICVFSGQ
ncbi:MAG: heme-binding domain-containing protein [Bryobacteraceae bacterium]|nr:heme-binding domain-containing protein [Bryobacteraceae bacterium]MDW8379578.1 heme-binding domain-containing protein [Bryobacterales bacterium]